MDHRRNLPPAPPDAPWVSSDRAVGNFVTQLPHRYKPELVARIRSKLPADAKKGETDLSPDLLRELRAVSAESRREIADKLEAGLRNDIVGIFKYVTDWQQTMSGLARRARQFSWLVTNIGVLDGNGKPGDAEKWSITRAQFGLSAEIPAAAIDFSPVTVTGRGMVFGANWPDCAVDATLAEHIMADMERWLAQLARQP